MKLIGWDLSARNGIFKIKHGGGDCEFSFLKADFIRTDVQLEQTKANWWASHDKRCQYKSSLALYAPLKHIPI